MVAFSSIVSQLGSPALIKWSKATDQKPPRWPWSGMKKTLELHDSESLHGGRRLAREQKLQSVLSPFLIPGLFAGQWLGQRFWLKIWKHVDCLLKEVMKLTGFIFDSLPSYEFTDWLFGGGWHSSLDPIQLDCLFGRDRGLFPVACSWVLGCLCHGQTWKRSALGTKEDENVNSS